MIYLNGTSKFSVLDKEYSFDVFQTLLAVPHFRKLQGKARSSRPEVFYKNGVIENFANHRFEFCEIFKSTFFHGTPPGLLVKS